MADSVVSIYDLDISGFLQKQDQIIDGFEKIYALEKKAGGADAFQGAAKSASDFEREVSTGVQKTAQLEAAIEGLKQETKSLNTELRAQARNVKTAADAAKYKQSQSDVKMLREEIKRLNQELANTSKRGQEATSIMSRIKGGFLGAFTGFSTGGGAGVQAASAVLGAINPALGVMAGLLGGVATKAFNATSAWQGYSAALASSLGSQDLANKNLSVLEDLAVKLPVGLNEVTESFNQLVNRGFKPTKDELANLSGFAAAQNKTFDQLIQAILDAENGELERLKEFGIQAANEGGKVSVTFRGITKTFEKGALDSASAFADLAKELGSDKLNAAKMDTLAGRMSNLSDQGDKVARKFGEVLLPVFESILSLASGFLGVIDDIITGFSSFGVELGKLGETSQTHYPTLEKIFSLFSDDDGKIEQARSVWERFFFSLRVGFERIIATAEAFVDISSNLFNPSGVAVAIANYKRNLDQIDKVVDQFYSKNAKRTGPSDFQYKDSPNKSTQNKPVSDAEKKLMEKRASQLADLEKKLQDELLKIENEYGKEKLEALKDNELVYIEEKKKYDLMRIDQEQKALLALKQLVAGARKGQYDRNGKVVADTSATLSASESAPFDFRRKIVEEQAAKDRADFINSAEKEITSILSNEYQKQLQATEYKYEELFKLAEKAGIDTVKLERKKQEELNKIELDYLESQLDKEKGQNIGGNELDVIQAQIDGRIDLELEARKRMLEIEKMYNEEKIKLIEQYGTEEEKERIQPIIKANKEIELSIKELENSILSMKFDPNTLITQLFGEKGGEAFKDAAKSIISSISEVYAVQERLVQQRISRIDDEISKKEEQVEKETELNEEGVANNLNLRLKELNDLKAARERAIEDQKRLQRAQLLIDTVSQASSMITAASKVFAGFATIPVVGVGLGIAAVALMLGAFAAAKIKSFQLVNQASQFEKGGRHKGKRHSEGGEIVEVEDGEWTINRRSSQEHDELLEAINSNDKRGMLDYLLNELLDGTGVEMAGLERRRQMMFIAGQRKNSEEYSSEMAQYLKSMDYRLSEIEKNTSNITEWEEIPMGNNRTVRKNKKSGDKSVMDWTKFVEK